MIKAMQKGFTLIEVMIVVAIICIIASIALSSYNDYVKSGMAATATSELANSRIQLEQCYQDTRDYSHDDCADACPTDGSSFAYTCTRNNDDTYDLSALGSGKVSGFSFAIDEQNDKTSTYDGVGPVGCWKTSKTSSC